MPLFHRPTHHLIPWLLSGLNLLACAPAQSSAAKLPPAVTLTLRLPPLPAAPGTKAFAPQTVQSVTVTPDSEECGSSAFELPGQAWHIGLTSGGISLWGGSNGAAVNAPTTQALYGVLPDQLDVSAPQEVRLFILDHFAPVRLLLRETAQSPVTEVSVVHGALVEAHLRAILESAGFSLVPGRPSGSLSYQRGGRMIRLERVALDSFSPPGSKAFPGQASLPTTGGQIRDALQNNAAFKAFLLGAKDISAIPTSTVLNMSFSMLPCDIMTNYRTRRDLQAASAQPSRYTLNGYVQDLAALNHLPLADLQRRLTEVSPTEPLMEYLSGVLSQRSSRRVLAVASSGNYGLDFATAPAAAPNVISVGATTWDGSVLDWSDKADVNAVGEWYTLSAEQLARFCREGGTCVASDVLSHPEHYQDFAYRKSFHPRSGRCAKQRILVETGKKDRSQRVGRGVLLQFVVQHAMNRVFRGV